MSTASAGRELDPTTNRERDELRKEIGRNIVMVAPIRYAPAVQTDTALAVPARIELGTEKVSLSAASKRGFGEGLRRDAPIWVIQSLRRQARLAAALFVRCAPNGRQNGAYCAAEVTRSAVDRRPMRRGNVAGRWRFVPKSERPPRRSLQKSDQVS